MTAPKPKKTKKSYATYNGKSPTGFLEVYRANGGHIRKSCDIYGIHITTFYDWKIKFPEFVKDVYNTDDYLKDFWDDCAIKEMAKGNSTILMHTHKSLKGTRKFPMGNTIPYDLNNLNTLEDIKQRKLQVMADMGKELISVETGKTIMDMLDSTANGFIDSDGMAKLIAMAEKAKKFEK